jgi:hypothetical protein
MADVWQIVEREPSDSRPAPRQRRGLVIASVIAIPIAIGVLLSSVLYATRVTPPVPGPLPRLNVTDTFVRNGPVLLLEPATSAPFSMVAGQKIEIVLQTGVGQRVSVLEPSVLESVANPQCHLTPICGVVGAGAWTFVAHSPGTTHLHVIFGTGTCSQRASCPLVLQLLIPITVRPVAG